MATACFGYGADGTGGWSGRVDSDSEALGAMAMGQLVHSGACPDPHDFRLFLGPVLIVDVFQQNFDQQVKYKNENLLVDDEQKDTQVGWN